MEALRVQIREAGYDEHQPIIHDIGFEVEAGQWIGLIGPNGAGKSTTVKAVIGLLSHVKGEISFHGPKGTYAYIPEQPIVYDSMTLWEHLELAAAAYEMDRADFAARAEKLLEQFRMTEVKHHLPSSFSKGMRQKMMLMIGFLLQPDIYIVDEPFIGLDPKATKQFLDLLNAERDRGAAVLMSTHVLDTAEKICDSFLLIDGGKVVAQGTLEQIRKQSGLPGASLFDCFHRLT